MGRNRRWLCLLVLAGCGSWEPPTTVAPGHEGPIRSRDVEGGEHTFLTLCVACHRGRVNPAGYHWTAAQMRHQIREGNRLMPPIPSHRLSDEQVEAVLAYLSTIDAIAGELPPHPDAWLEDAWLLDEAARARATRRLPSPRTPPPEPSPPDTITAAPDQPSVALARALDEP